MALSIKNPRADELVGRLVRLTGETKTEAVIQSLQERLDRLSRENSENSLFDDIMEIARKVDALPNLDDRSPDEILGYDEDGLPT